MGNTTALFLRQFGSADIEVAIHLKGVAIDNFSIELFRDPECQIALSRSCGTANCNQWSLRRVWVYEVWGFNGQTPLYNESMVSSLSRDAAGPKRE